mmetsp:Transcript_21463/g.64388  ORF Transcript_21463/g.64388 Transcript_21463/m.64388 type:complete len:251 (+) Transcript_21463:137-889(+)
MAGAQPPQAKHPRCATRSGSEMRWVSRHQSLSGLWPEPLQRLPRHPSVLCRSLRRAYSRRSSRTGAAPRPEPGCRRLAYRGSGGWQRSGRESHRRRISRRTCRRSRRSRLQGNPGRVCCSSSPSSHRTMSSPTRNSQPRSHGQAAGSSTAAGPGLGPVPSPRPRAARWDASRPPVWACPGGHTEPEGRSLYQEQRRPLSGRCMPSGARPPSRSCPVHALHNCKSAQAQRFRCPLQQTSIWCSQRPRPSGT